MWACAAICIEASPKSPKSNRVWGWPTTSKPSNTVLRASYARILETPFNENLVVASVTGDPLLDAIFGGSSGRFAPVNATSSIRVSNKRSGRYLVVDADYLWKYTHNAYDFSDLLNTPIFFPIGWHNSKISGFNGRVSVPNFHGVTVLTVFGHASARYFQPQVGGLGPSDGSVFRIDHDQVFQETTHAQYQPGNAARGWHLIGRYDSGLVAGAVPFAGDTTTPVDLTGLSADQQIQAGLFCGSATPTRSAPLVTCDRLCTGRRGLRYRHPERRMTITIRRVSNPRHLFDASVGDDDLFHGDRYKWSLRLTAINLTKQGGALQFPVHIQRNAFCDPADVYGRTRLPLLRPPEPPRDPARVDGQDLAGLRECVPAWDLKTVSAHLAGLAEGMASFQAGVDRPVHWLDKGAADIPSVDEN